MPEIRSTKKELAWFLFFNTLVFLFLYFGRIGGDFWFDTLGPTNIAWLTDLSQMVAILTRPAAVVATFCIAGLLAVKTHHTRGLLIIAGVSLITACATELLKLIFTVTRPGESLVAIYGYSFPSTHAGTMAAFLMAAISQSKTAYSHNRNTFILWLGLAVFGVGFVAASRVLIGVHTVADVLAGIIVGLFCARIVKTFATFSFDRAGGRTN